MKLVEEIENIGKQYPMSIRQDVLDIIYCTYVNNNEKLDYRVANKNHIDWILEPASRQKEIQLMGVWISTELSWGLSQMATFCRNELKKRRRFSINDWYNAKSDSFATTDLITGDKTFSREEEINRLLLEGKRSQIWKNFYQDKQGRTLFNYIVMANYNDRETIKNLRNGIAMWDPDNKWWVLSPLTNNEEEYDTVMKELVTSIKLTPHSDLLLHWYGDQNSILSSLNAHHDEQMDEFKLQPYPYQKAGIVYGQGKKRLLIADEMGLGKTMQAIGITVREDAFPALVICPKSVVYNWKKEWDKFTNIKANVYGEAGRNANVMIVSYENAKYYLPVKDHFKTVIVDESHNIRNEGTKRTKIITELSMGKEYRIFLTGTPMINSPKDFIPQLMALGWLKPETKAKFLQRYVSKNQGINLEELQVKLRSTCMIRRMKKDVSTELPPVIRQVISCELTDRADYDMAVNQFERYLEEKLGFEEKKINSMLQAEMLTKIQLLKKLAAKALLPLIVESAKEEIEQGNKIVLFAHHKEIISELAKELDTKLVINGDTSTEDRMRYVRTFVEDSRSTAIVMSIRAGSEGIDGLQEASSLVFFCELDWTAARHDQAEARLHRTGQNGDVVARYFMPVKTVYEKIFEIIERKREESNTVTGSEADIVKQKSVFKEFMKEMYNVEFNEATEKQLPSGGEGTEATELEDTAFSFE